MKIIIKILRAIVVVLSFGTLGGYYLVTSDVPPVVGLNDLYTFMAVYLIAIIITITDFTVCIRYNYRGGYSTLCLEVIILFLWILSYNGVNFLIINNGVNCIIRNILIGGIITSTLQILTQIMCLIVSGHRTQGGTGGRFCWDTGGRFCCVNKREKTERRKDEKNN